MGSYAILSTIIIVWSCFSSSNGVSCDSCGGECAAACGTRNFRTCCFNYLKKRADPPTGPQMRLELLMVLPELMHYYRPALKHILPTQGSHGANEPNGSQYPQSQIQLVYKNTQPSEGSSKMDDGF